VKAQNTLETPTNDRKKLPIYNGASSQTIREICLKEGVDDAGFVEINRKSLGSVNDEVLSLYSKTKTIISICKNTNRENVQSQSRSLANEEFHKTYDDLSEVSRRIVKQLNNLGIRGVSCHPSFPMNMDKWAGKIWEISHKPIAVEAGLGTMGINRMVLHPRFGSFVLLDSILIDTEVDVYDKPIDFNPCVSCHLCVSVCPVGAIDVKKGLDFNACMTHNYRDFMGGFMDWIENIASSKNIKDFRAKSLDNETISKWQSLSFGPQYKSAHCVSVCPAGDDVFNIFKSNKKDWNQTIVKPLKEKKESVYVQKGTQAEENAKKNTNKQIVYVKNVTRPSSINGFFTGARMAFDPKLAKDVNMNVHFVFYGKENKMATIIIKDKTVSIKEGLEGTPDLKVRCDSEIWLKIIRKDISSLGMIKGIFSKKLQVQGGLRRLKQFQKCFVET